MERRDLTRDREPQAAARRVAPRDLVEAIENALALGRRNARPGIFDRKDRAKRYLQCIAALTGATQMGNSYVLDVGKTRFRVRHRYVSRLRDMTDPGCALEETCFYPAYKDMPKAEEIATALLQLMSNPALFDRWAAQSGAFKANGHAFSPSQ